ncbi:hypothetical protein [Hahella ganghwensis]|uniref:hypothetical protein n=1 Tax=Hahella ganghwensis TaxID=286420 RepID=UPI0003729AC2|nr:hypothetical protein [Hahella ganghwensis]
MKGILALPLFLISLYTTNALAFEEIEPLTEEGCGDIHMEIQGVCVWKPYVATRTIRDLQREIKAFKATLPVASNKQTASDESKKN